MLRAAALMVEEGPGAGARLVIPVVGGPSGTGLARPERLHQARREARHLRHGFASIPPVGGRSQLADWYRAAQRAWSCPSYSESFGLVAVEAQACGTPVVAAAVGGLHEAVYRFLLQRNARLYGVHYTLDRMGDIHLVGRVPLGAVSTDEIDRVLGQVLEAADGDFNTLLELGFASSIRREYAWRSERGESTANLKAFEHLFT